jgi:2'-5' RNA ligase
VAKCSLRKVSQLIKMEPTKQNYFIALLPPEPIRTEVTRLKEYCRDRYQTKAALRSPPHITLHPPFRWDSERLADLKQSLHRFANPQTQLPIKLEGFATFPKQVIFIDVERSPGLLSLHTNLARHLEAELELVDAKAKTRPFKPHMTIAFRDLSKAEFKHAWAEFKERSIAHAFLADALTLLVHDGKRWQINATFPLS